MNSPEFTWNLLNRLKIGGDKNPSKFKKISRKSRIKWNIENTRSYAKKHKKVHGKWKV